MITHPLLQRQVRKCLGEHSPLPAEWEALLSAVEEAYTQFDADRKLVERSTQLSSNELIEANSRLRDTFERDQAVLESLRMSVHALRANSEGPIGDGSSDLLDLSNLVREQLHLRTAAEEKIRQQAALLDTANDAIYVCSLEGMVIYWNRGAERLYGWTAAESLNRNIATFLPPESNAAPAVLQQLMAQGTWSGERRQVTKDGLSVVVYSRMTLVRDAAGKPQSVFTINTDMTEKKEIEAQFLRAQRMESLGALASGIAHDLNNVLVPVVLGTQLLRSGIRTEAELKVLADIETSAQRGADIVRQVLTFARGVEGERVALGTAVLLREMETIAATSFPKNIRIKTEMGRDVWPITGDATQVHQILLNLCINARDAMPEGGTITLRATNDADEEASRSPVGKRKVWTALERLPGKYVCLSVSDTGTGIPPEILDKVFEPFFTTKPTGKGTGLGLSTVLGIVRSHGGFLRVVSTPGEGSTFELHFPAAPQAVPSPSRRPDLGNVRGSGQTVMVVDDEKAVRDIAVAILEKYGYTTVSAANGHEALEKFKQGNSKIEAVISDMAMPGMDGPTLVKMLRQVEPGVRIIGMSGHGDGGTSSRGPWGIPMFLTKPFTVERLLNALHATLQGPRPPA